MFLISYGYKLFEIITPLPPTDRLFIYRCDKTMQKWGMWNSTAQIMDHYYEAKKKFFVFIFVHF